MQTEANTGARRESPGGVPAEDLTGSAVEVVGGDWVPGRGGYYADDLVAIQQGAPADGQFYVGDPVTPGHPAVRSASATLSVGLRTASGGLSWGDACTPQYSGFGGRDLPIDPLLHGPDVETAIAALAAAGSLTFECGCSVLEDLRIDGRPLHTGIRYGVSQALLGLIASAAGAAPAQLLAQLLGRDELRPVPLYSQSGEDRYRGVDKMIMKRVEVLPHGLINSPALFGDNGSVFLEYATWVRDRVLEFGDSDYRPTLHFDVYGLLGREMGSSTEKMLDFCGRLADLCQPLRIQLEAPIYGSSGEETREHLATLHTALRDRAIPVALVADDWCNGIEDITSFARSGAVDLIQLKMPDLGSLTNALAAARVCREHAVGVFIGGSCTETEVSARYSAHLALAVGADQVLAKPGMGVDEGVLVVGNEMSRVLTTTQQG